MDGNGTVIIILPQFSYLEQMFGFLPPIEPSLEIESIKRDPARTLQHCVAFFRD